MGRLLGTKNGSIIKHSCIQCRSIFNNHNKITKFCSHKCFSDSRKIERKGKCLDCENIFEQRQPNGSARIRLFCDSSCAMRYRMKLKPSRYWLGKKRPDLSIKYRGSGGSGWKGGVSTKNEIARHSVEFRIWRKSVFERDNYTCQKCKKKGGYLHPHHVQNFSEHIAIRFVIDNGITFCVQHHKEFHKLFGNKNNNLEQIKKFL